jgi:hypothetical protein
MLARSANKTKAPPRRIRKRAGSVDKRSDGPEISQRFESESTIARHEQKALPKVNLAILDDALA